MKHALAIAITLCAFAAPAAAGENCTCRASNVEAQEGQTVCVATSNGSQMARCEKVLNNTSWKFLGTPCPVSHLSSGEQPDPVMPSVSGS